MNNKESKQQWDEKKQEQSLGQGAERKNPQQASQPQRDSKPLAEEPGEAEKRDKRFEE